MFFLTPVLTQFIQFTTLKDDNGFGILKLEEIPMVQNYSKIFHIINLGDFNQAISILESNFMKLNLSQSDVGFKILNRELQNLKRNMDSLTPAHTKTRRSRRGLINVLGSTLKFLTGSMDNEDSEEIFKHLQNLDFNSQQLTEKTNEHIKYTARLSENIRKITDHLHDQQEQIKNFMINVENQTNNLIAKITRPAFILELYSNIITINKHIQDIKDIILLSRLEVLAHDILTVKEIEDFEINVEMLPYIKSAILFDESKIVIVLLIPIFTKEKYYKSLILPFPNEFKEQLDSPIQTIVLQGTNIFQFQNQKVLTKQNLIPPLDDCIKNLLNNNNTCTFKINDKESVTKLNDELILVLNFPKTEINQNCIDHKIFIKANGIVKFNNCAISIKNYNYSNLKRNYIDNIPVIPVLSNFNVTKIVNNVNLKNIQIKQEENLKLIKYIGFDNNIKNYVSISLNVILLITTMISLIFIYLRIKNKINFCNSCFFKSNQRSNDIEMNSKDNEDIVMNKQEIF